MRKLNRSALAFYIFKPYEVESLTNQPPTINYYQIFGKGGPGEGYQNPF